MMNWSSAKEVVARVGIHELFVLFFKKCAVLFATQKAKRQVFSGRFKCSPGKLAN